MLKNDRDLSDSVKPKIGKTDEIIHTADIIWLVTTKPYIVKSFKSMEKMLSDVNYAIDKTKMQ